VDWNTLGEIVKVLGAVATAAAAWFAASVAYRGLEKWRSETLGKRRAEVAASALATIYEAEDILREARGPWVLPHEMVKREGIPDEFAENPNFAPEARLLKHLEFFAKLRVQRHEFAAVFGKDAARPFDEMLKARIEINHAVDSMVRTSKELRDSTVPGHRTLWDEYYYTAFRHFDPSRDLLSQRIAEQVKAMESTCRPAIEAAEPKPS
jgi:hypothetical protein